MSASFTLFGPKSVNKFKGTQWVVSYILNCDMLYALFVMVCVAGFTKTQNPVTIRRHRIRFRMLNRMHIYQAI